MNDIKEQYISALEDYLAGKGEPALEKAYELGRRAIAQGLGILHMASVHQDAMTAVLLRALTPQESAEITKKATGFFCESLAPFEMTFRGFQESITRLLDLNRELERSENDLRKAHDELEVRVLERTAELARTNEELRKERDKAQKYLDIAGAMIVVIGSDQKVVLVNRKCCEILGYNEHEIVGKNWFETFLPERVRDEVKAGFVKLMAGEIEPVEFFENPVLTRSREERVIAWHNAVLRNGAGNITGTISSGEDITDRKRAEEERERWASELARSNAELEQFAYVASHDLQEPLRMISGFTQLLARRYKDRLDENAYEFIDYIVDGATRMQRMIEDLLAYSRVGTRGNPFELISCKDIFDQVIANLKMAIGENNAQVTHDPLPAIMADSTQMTQLFQNLISNAIKFRGEEPPRVHISVKRAGNEWVFSVRDNGIGIAPEFFDRLFQIFQRLHTGKEYPGTGIGLAICKKIVERHGGRIWVESEVGRGSTFYFTIPVRSPG